MPPLSAPGTTDSTPQSSARLVFTPRLVLGLLAVVAGALLLLDQAGVLASRSLAGWWPLALAGIGAVQILFGDHPLAKALGICLVLLGGSLVFAHLNPELLRSADVWNYAWPTALLLVGGFLVVRSLRHKPAAKSPGRVAIFSVWSGQEHKLDTAHFEGGEVTTVMGGFELDLREADIPPGAQAELDVFALMGGGAITVPKDWNVEVDVLPFMGGVSVKTSHREGDSRKHLRIKGLAIMGGIEVRT